MEPKLVEKRKSDTESEVNFVRERRLHTSDNWPFMEMSESLYLRKNCKQFYFSRRKRRQTRHSNGNSTAAAAVIGKKIDFRLLPNATTAATDYATTRWRDAQTPQPKDTNVQTAPWLFRTNLENHCRREFATLPTKNEFAWMIGRVWESRPKTPLHMHRSREARLSHLSSLLFPEDRGIVYVLRTALKSVSMRTPQSPRRIAIDSVLHVRGVAAYSVY